VLPQRYSQYPRGSPFFAPVTAFSRPGSWCRSDARIRAAPGCGHSCRSRVGLVGGMYVRGRRLGKHLYWARAGSVAVLQYQWTAANCSFIVVCEKCSRVIYLCAKNFRYRSAVHKSVDVRVDPSDCPPCRRHGDILACQLDSRGTVIAERALALCLKLAAEISSDNFCFVRRCCCATSGASRRQCYSGMREHPLPLPPNHYTLSSVCCGVGSRSGLPGGPAATTTPMPSLRKGNSKLR